MRKAALHNEVNFFVAEQINHYDAESTYRSSKGLEGAVRRRPGIYIGSTDERGLHHLVYLKLWTTPLTKRWRASATTIRRHPRTQDNIRQAFTDNGRGIPAGIHPKLGRPAVEVCLTVLHAGGKFGGEGCKKFSGGLHGVGASVVNALSRHLQVKVYQDGKIYQQEYERGKVLYDLKVVGETDRTGTTVRFWPDVKTGEIPDGIFETGDFDFDTLKTPPARDGLPEQGHPHHAAGRARRDRHSERVFHYEGGIRAFVEYLNQNKEACSSPSPIYIEGVKDGIHGGGGHAVQRQLYTRTSSPSPTTSTPPRAAPIWRASTRALTRVINDYGRKNEHPQGQRRRTSPARTSARA